MTFLAIDAQKSLFTLQKSQVEFEQMLILNQVNWCTKQMNTITQTYNEMYGDDTDAPQADEDPYFIELQQMEEQLQTRKSNLDSQITLLNEEINSCKTMTNNNIKQACGLNLLGS